METIEYSIIDGVLQSVTTRIIDIESFKLQITQLQSNIDFLTAEIDGFAAKHETNKIAMSEAETKMVELNNILAQLV